MPEWIAQNVGTALTVGGSIIVAVVGGVFGIWAKHHSPRQPIPIQDVWSENRALRADLVATENRYDDLEDRYRKARDALAVMWDYVRRLRANWGRTPIPVLTSSERRAVAAVIEDLDTPNTGTPVVSNIKE
jgi:hypothetical protein